MPKELQYSQVWLETYRITVFDLAKFTVNLLQSNKATLELLQNFISVFDQILQFFTTPKVSILCAPCILAGRTLEVSPRQVGMTNTTQKLPVTLGEQFAWLAQTPAAFYTLLQVDVHHGQSQTAQLPHLWNT